MTTKCHGNTPLPEGLQTQARIFMTLAAEMTKQKEIKPCPFVEFTQLKRLTVPLLAYLTALQLSRAQWRKPARKPLKTRRKSQKTPALKASPPTKTDSSNKPVSSSEAKPNGVSVSNRKENRS